MVNENNRPLLSVENLTKVYTSGVFIRDVVTAVKNASFQMHPGSVMSLIGESGSGKTTIGKLILKLLQPTEGKIFYRGKDITSIRSKQELKEYYRKVQGVFQDPFSSFNPLFRVDRVFDMIFDVFFPETTNRDEKVQQALKDVNLNPERILNQFPHQLSGGQLQRLLIARALLLDVDILIADELISMLDASTRMGVLNLLVDICKRNNMSVLFITHDLALGYYISDYTMIMHKGRLVEKGDTKKVYSNPIHPYTKMLFNSVPDIGHRWDKDEKFVPEMVLDEVEEFYQKHRGQGFVDVDEEHTVLFSVN